jgi:hypothetical protein
MLTLKPTVLHHLELPLDVLFVLFSRIVFSLATIALQRDDLYRFSFRFSHPYSPETFCVEALIRAGP